MYHVRCDHDPRRQLLQVRELWYDERLRVVLAPWRVSRGRSSDRPRFVLLSLCSVPI